MPIPATVQGVRVVLKRGVVKSFVLSFSDAPNPAAARAKLSYRLAWAGRDRRFGTRDDVKLPIRSVVYDAANWSVSLIPRDRIVLNKTIQLRVCASRLIDVYGRPLDGNRDGQPGGDFVALISKRAVTVTSVVGAPGVSFIGPAAVAVPGR
jgi:hypothetical protein